MIESMKCAKYAQCISSLSISKFFYEFLHKQNSFVCFVIDNNSYFFLNSSFAVSLMPESILSSDNVLTVKCSSKIVA